MNGIIIIGGDTGVGLEQLKNCLAHLPQPKEIILVSDSNNLQEKEEDMIGITRSGLMLIEERPYRSLDLDMFDIERLLRSPKPFKIKQKIKKDALYKRGSKNNVKRIR